MNPDNGLRKTPEEIIDAVKEDSDLTPVEKETTFGFAKCDNWVHVYTEEAGIARRLLKHPEFSATELRVTTDDAWGRRVSSDAYSGGTVTGVEGCLPIGALKVSARSRSTSRHASVVSKEVSSMWTEMMDDENQNHNQSQTNSRTQDPPNRPEVSAVTGRNVYRAIMDLRLASTDDLVRHDIVDRSKRQVQRALDKAQDKDLINYVRDGRRVLYYIAPEFLTKEEKDQYGL